MVNANELRVGSFIDPINEDFWGQPFAIEQIAMNGGQLGAYYRNGSCWANLESIEPIALTEEWLLKFGFEKSARGVSFEIGIYLEGVISTFRLMKNNKGWWTIIEQNKNPERVGINTGTIKYVHQLQNLYFDLTGEELKIKE